MNSVGLFIYQVMENPRERKERLAREQVEQKRIKDIVTKVKRSVRSDINKSGLLSVRYKLEHIRKNPGSEPETGLTRERLIQTYNEAINQYLKLKK